MSLVETRSTDDRVAEISRPEFWRAHFPALSINRRLAGTNLPQIEPDAARKDLWRARMGEEAYLQDASATLAELGPRLAEAVETCHRLDIPPAFIFLFDEAWECFFSLDPMLRFFLGDNYRVLPDFWTWRLDPRKADAGWRPHRDKGRAALRSDGGPASLTVWIPLTDAIPQNGCMYMLPANRDPVYGSENEGRWQIDVAKVRALPAKVGEFLCWNQAVLHWGGEASRFAPHPRMSMALEFQMGERAPFNTPLIEPFANLAFEIRLRLVGKQILQYKHMYPLAARFEALARRLLSPS
jgi:hypothetical protein